MKIFNNHKRGYTEDSRFLDIVFSITSMAFIIKLCCSLKYEFNPTTMMWVCKSNTLKTILRIMVSGISL